MIYAILIGLIIGAVAKFLMPGKDPGGFIITVLLGIGGSVVAHWVGTSFGLYLPGEGAGFVSSVLGAMLLLWAYRSVSGRRSSG